MVPAQYVNHYPGISVEEFVYHQVEHYTERLLEERSKPDSERKTKVIAFLRGQLHGIYSANNNSLN